MRDEMRELVWWDVPGVVSLSSAPQSFTRDRAWGKVGMYKVGWLIVAIARAASCKLYSTEREAPSHCPFASTRQRHELKSAIDPPRGQVDRGRRKGETPLTRIPS